MTFQSRWCATNAGQRSCGDLCCHSSAGDDRQGKTWLFDGYVTFPIRGWLLGSSDLTFLRRLYTESGWSHVSTPQYIISLCWLHLYYSIWYVYVYCTQYYAACLVRMDSNKPICFYHPPARRHHRLPRGEYKSVSLHSMVAPQADPDPDIPGGQARQVENYYLGNSH